MYIHLNYFMFIPQVDEQTLYDKNGVAVNDINSLSEFVSDVILHNKEHRKDEDDNNARYFHGIKSTCNTVPRLSAVRPFTFNPDSHLCPFDISAKPLSPFHEVIKPPPKG